MPYPTLRNLAKQPPRTISLKAYLREAIESYFVDPSDTEYQEGYLACLEELAARVDDGTIR